MGTALAVLILLSPLFAVIAALVFFSSRGPNIYSDERIGWDGRFFRAFKFRTMYDHAQLENGNEQRSAKPGGATLEEILRDPVASEEFDRTRKLANDPRVTPLGRFLRRSSLDEASPVHKRLAR